MLYTHSHQFIKNKEVDALYFALSLLSFAQGLISIFVPIYLWSIGFTLPYIILYFFLEAVYFILLSLVFSRFFHRLTDKIMILIGVPFIIAYYAVLPFSKALGPYVFLLPIMTSMYGLFFNVGFHTDFSCASDNNDDDLGDEIGAQNTFSAVVAFASPLLGGLLIAATGYNWTFWLATLVSAVALIPLFFFKGHKPCTDKISNRNVYRTIFSKKYRGLVWGSVGYAIDASVGGVLWPLYIFLIFTSTKTVGGIYSGIALISAVVSFLTGKYANKSRYAQIIKYTVPFIVLVWVARVLFPGSLTVLITVPLKTVFYAAMIVAWGGIYYVLTKKACPCGELILATENTFNLSRVAVLGLFTILAFVLPQNTLWLTMFGVTAATTWLISRMAYQYV